MAISTSAFSDSKRPTVLEAWLERELRNFRLYKAIPETYLEEALEISKAFSRHNLSVTISKFGDKRFPLQFEGFFLLDVPSSKYARSFSQYKALNKIQSNAVLSTKKGICSKPIPKKFSEFFVDGYLQVLYTLDRKSNMFSKIEGMEFKELDAQLKSFFYGDL